MLYFSCWGLVCNYQSVSCCNFNRKLILAGIHNFILNTNNFKLDTSKFYEWRNTQQHIHHKLIEKAKDILTTTNFNVGEIAYQLGFEYPQSFSKRFKSKTNLTPMEYRHSYD